MKWFALFLLATCGTAFADLRDDQIVSVAKDDPQMAAAFAKARSELDKFLAVLQANSSDMCSVKVGIVDGKEEEYFWLVDLTYADDSFTGTINNTPELVKNVKFGDKITVKKEKIVDWLYMKGGKMYGNYTGRALLPKMSKEDAAELRAMLAP